VILDKTAVLVVTKGVYSALKIIPKDNFGNKTSIEEKAVHIDIRKVSVWRRSGREKEGERESVCVRERERESERERE
jgi:hypothetical protein